MKRLTRGQIGYLFGAATLLVTVGLWLPLTLPPTEAYSIGGILAAVLLILFPEGNPCDK